MNYGYPLPGFPALPPPQGVPPFAFGAAAPPSFFPPPQGFLPPQQPQQNPLEDRNFFRQWFASGLRALVGNSKPIITDLTIAASDWAARHSDIIVQLLDEHIRNADPSVKLPPLYLIDSICKNIGMPYTTGFAQRIDRIFLLAYREVDPPTQVKMEELLGTWRTGGPNGTQLFHGRAQQDIEKTLFGPDLRGGGIGGQGKGASDTRHFLSGAQQLPSMASQAERQGVLGDVRKLLGIWEMRKRLRPDDSTPDEQIKALQQLETLLKTATLTADMVNSIRNEITNLTPPDASSASSSAAGPSNVPDLSGIDFSKLAAILPTRTPSGNSANPTPSSTTPIPGQDAALALLRALNPSTVAQLKGLGSSSSKVPAIIAPAVVDAAEAAYEEMLLKMNLRLTATDIARYRPTAPDLLYDRLSLQCKQCGARFLESSGGHAKLATHTDRHFRHNKRLREATRAQSRSWFVSEDEWITPPKQLRQAAPELNVESLDLEENKPLGKVVAPKDPARSARPCPICREGFKSEFNEAEEEFVWLDAVEVDGVIYHDSCRREAMKARLSTKRSGSREGTPMSADGRSLTPVPPSLVKRKAEDEGGSAVEEPDVKRVKSEDTGEDVES